MRRLIEWLKGAAIILVVAVLLASLASILVQAATGGFKAHAAPLSVTTTRMVWITFYAARDNDPAGSRDIAYPGPAPRHAQATADIGSFDHPITLASDQRWLPVGTRVYVASLHKYYVMEDQCVECEADFSHGFHHVDLYMSDSVQPGVIAAEDQATKDQAENSLIAVNPPPNWPVDATPLYTDSGGSAWPTHHYPDTLPSVVPPNPPPVGRCRFHYVVVRGDTLVRIARRYHMRWQTLFAANRTIIRIPSRIFPGQRLCVP